VEFHFICKRFA